MKRLFNVKKHFALFSLLVLGLTMPNAAWAYLASCPHEKYINETNGICKNCNAGIIIFYTQGESKPDFVGYPANAFGEGSSYVKCIEIGHGNPKKIAIIFTAPVTIIPAGMYWDSDKLYSIVLPNTVKTIQTNAFNDCKWLSSVTIGSKVETIGTNAFSNCDNLTSVVLPESVTNIGYGAFYGCDGLEKIVIPENVETIGSNAFGNCEKLTTVVVEGADTQIKNDAFAGSDKIENVEGSLPQVEAITGVAADKSKDKQPQPQENVKELKLALTDGLDLSLYPNAKITTDSYIREGVSNAWGTICLPFDVESNQSIQYYQLSSVDPATGVMSFAKMDEVKANTPCVFQKLNSETTLEFSSSLPAEMNKDNVEYRIFEDDDWYIVGTYQNLVLNVAAGGNEEGQNLYYISSNKFWHAEGTLRMKPFRAYFQYKGSSFAAASRFSVAVSANELATDLRPATMEEEDGVLYDLLGNRVEKMVEGRIYILNGKKVMFK